MNIDIRPIHYHKTISEDGITHRVDIGEQKTAYQVNLHETFWDCNDELEAKALLVQELINLRKELVNEINNRLSQKRGR